MILIQAILVEYALESREGEPIQAFGLVWGARPSVKLRACSNPGLATELGARHNSLGTGRAHPGLSTACCARHMPMGAGRAYEL
ncbi:hypothetical protein L195_g049858 [Trifolium pratense]|uniref:Uncharacterized protein n=1 Tax=Trifolium pratense TaxID=57577 RepID=A0A2K3JQU7_TRIPR|nr:hypothetical protein L195_g049858 [Trifolium pratense]